MEPTKQNDLKLQKAQKMMTHAQKTIAGSEIIPWKSQWARENYNRVAASASDQMAASMKSKWGKGMQTQMGTRQRTGEAETKRESGFTVAQKVGLRLWHKRERREREREQSMRGDGVSEVRGIGRKEREGERRGKWRGDASRGKSSLGDAIPLKTPSVAGSLRFRPPPGPSNPRPRNMLALSALRWPLALPHAPARNVAPALI